MIEKNFKFIYGDQLWASLLDQTWQKCEKWTKCFLQVPVLDFITPHLWSLLPAHTGSNRTRRKSLAESTAKSANLRNHTRVDRKSSCRTNTQALSFAAHKGKKNTRGHLELWTDLHLPGYSWHWQYAFESI